MDRKLLRISRILTAVFTFCFGLLWLNNLVSAARFHLLLLAGSPNAAEKAEGIFPFLAWSTVDVSTITTFVPFFGFLLFFAALSHIRRSAQWPYFPGYERLNVALGLLGTIWGIILIGFYPAADISIASLMKCLHTAMFSTLIAVGWVMVLMPLILTPWSRKILSAALPAPEEDGPELEEVLTTLYAQLQKGSETLSGVSQELRSFSEAMISSKKAMESLAETAAEREKEESRFRQEAAAAISAFALTAEKWTAQWEAVNAENRRLTEEKKQLQETLAASRQTISELQGKLAALKELLQ